jgi:hypothetical protein
VPSPHGRAKWRINWMRSMAEQRLSMIEVLARKPA